MSRPCFALSVMLSCLASPILILGTTHAHDTISPSHDPGECIVCPLVHGPLEMCGGYSDYDYNEYWYDDPTPSTPSAPAAAATDPELEVADAQVGESTDNGVTFEYQDYYADYIFGVDTTSEESNDAPMEVPTSSNLADKSPSEAPSTTEVTEDVAASEHYGEYGWYDEYGCYADDYTVAEDRLNSQEPSESIESVASEPTLAESSTSDYETYEQEWFSYGAETTVATPKVNATQTVDAGKASSDETEEDNGDEIVATESANEYWGDEESWYCETYGYDAVHERETAEVSTEVESATTVETGYDPAYDEAMGADRHVAGTTVEDLSTERELHAADDYESFYDAYDDLYNFEPDSVAFHESASSDSAVESESDAEAELPAESEPAWLTDLVNRILAPTWLAENVEPATTSNSIYVDECAQAWDCEAEYWVQPQPEQASVVLGAADSLDELASMLQNAASLLRGLADPQLAETARASQGGSSR